MVSLLICLLFSTNVYRKIYKLCRFSCCWTWHWNFLLETGPCSILGTLLLSNMDMYSIRKRKISRRKVPVQKTEVICQKRSSWLLLLLDSTINDEALGYRKQVLPDGTTLMCQHYALPTRVCIFENPLFDGKTLIKIWKLNKYNGVIGVFNCQGAGWHPEEHKCEAYPKC